MPPKHKSIDGVTLDFLGSLKDNSLIVVVGRSNYKKSSESLDLLVKDLHAAGRSILWFESRSTQTSKLLDEKFQHFCGSKFSDWCSANQFIGSPLRKLIKSTILLMHPKRWSYFYSHAKSQNQRLAENLKTVIHQLHARQIYLFSHSAGGIVTSLVESEQSVKKLVCFGYPFKHPENDEEPIRTAHLRKMTKPFLIIQGNEDEYGSAQDSKRYKLSSSIEVIPIEADHGYDNLKDSEFRRCFDLLDRFLSNPLAECSSHSRAPPNPYPE